MIAIKLIIRLLLIIGIILLALQILLVSFGEDPFVSTIDYHSESMIHDKNLDLWWEDHKQEYLRYNLSKDDFIRFPFNNGLSSTDMIILIPASDLRVGDVVNYEYHKNGKLDSYILHRVIYISPEGYLVLKGDKNKEPLITEENIPKNKIKQKLLFKIPYIGVVFSGTKELFSSSVD